MSIVGFSQLGWVSASTADKMAQEHADTAVVTAMVPYCIAKAKQSSQSDALAKLAAEKSMYSRNDIVSSAGWATLGDAKFPDNALARACAAKLSTTS